MKSLFYRISGLFLALVLSAMLIPAPTAAAATAPYTTTDELQARLNSIIQKYNGTYWTTTGKPCTSAKCDSKYFAGRQCKGFANMVFDELFHGGQIGAYDAQKYYIPQPRNARLIEKSWGLGATAVSSVKSLLQAAKPGDYIQARLRSKTTGHSMIVISVSQDTISVLDANWDLRCGVKVREMSYKQWASKFIGFSIYRSTNYPKFEDVTTDFCNKKIQIANEYGRYLATLPSHSTAVTSVRRGDWSWRTARTVFTVETTADGWAGFRSIQSGRYITADKYTGHIENRGTSLQSWEAFRIYSDGNGNFLILSQATKKFISIGDSTVHADNTTSTSSRLRIKITN